VARRRHRDWYLALAERAEPKLRGPEQKRCLDRLELEHDNLRAALEWCKATSDGGELGLRLAAALRGFWENRGYFAEGRVWLEGLLFHGGSAAGGAGAPVLRIRALNSAGILAYRQGDYERVLALCGEARALSERHGDARGSAQALHFLAHVTQARGDYDGAAETMERSVALYREAADEWGIANSVDCLGEIARSKGDYARAAALTEQALVLYREVGETRGAAHTLHNLAYVRLHQGSTKEAAALFRESSRARAMQSWPWPGWRPRAQANCRPNGSPGCSGPWTRCSGPRASTSSRPSMRISRRRWPLCGGGWETRHSRRRGRTAAT
jgi:tetratricopeptide (TPR) repeat protein